MGVILALLAWLKAHVAIDKLFKIGKGGYEFKEARHKAIKAEVEARMLSRQEKLASLELAMYKLDGKVRQDHGWSVRIVDPNIYVEELKMDRDLVDEVLMRRGADMMRAHTTSRWQRDW